MWTRAVKVSCGPVQRKKKVVAFACYSAFPYQKHTVPRLVCSPKLVILSYRPLVICSNRLHQFLGCSPSQLWPQQFRLGIVIARSTSSQSSHAQAQLRLSPFRLVCQLLLQAVGVALQATLMNAPNHENREPNRYHVHSISLVNTWRCFRGQCSEF